MKRFTYKSNLIYQYRGVFIERTPTGLSKPYVYTPFHYWSVDNGLRECLVFETHDAMRSDFNTLSEAKAHIDALYTEGGLSD